MGVKTIRWHIENRSLERIGHVLRMKDERSTKAAVQGWLESLESRPKTKGKKRKTIPYWKKFLKKAGIEWTRAGGLAAGTEQWSSKVMERMQHLEEWERGRGNKNRNDPPVERNPGYEETDPLKCRWEGCGKICKIKEGLAIHIRRMHYAAKANLEFKCGACGMKFKSENTMINHQKVCGGAPPPLTGREKRRCDRCNGEFSKANIARHRRNCIDVIGEGDGGARGNVRPEERPQARVYTPTRQPENPVRSVAGCFPPQTWPDIGGAVGECPVNSSLELSSPRRIPCTSCSTHKRCLLSQRGRTFQTR